jgi:hypothetical protein
MLILKKQRNSTDSPLNGLALHSEWRPLSPGFPRVAESVHDCQALSFEIPWSLIVRANEVIE